MPKIVIDGYKLHYELRGNGVPFVPIPGARSSGTDSAPSLVGKLVKNCRVLLWDRRNAGASDVFFEGDRFEQEVWADDLAEVLERLKLSPAYVGGGGSGSRVALLAAIRHPEVVKGVILWSVAGGPFACQCQGFDYFVPYIRAAEAGGMEAVLKTPHFSKLAANNPANKERLLAMDPLEFARTMRRWASVYLYRSDMPVGGITRKELRSIKAPTLIFQGYNEMHPVEVTTEIHQLIRRSELVESPWTIEEWRQHLYAVPHSTVGVLFLRLADPILGFIQKCERASK